MRDKHDKSVYIMGHYCFLERQFIYFNSFQKKIPGLRHSTVGVFLLCTQPTWVQLSALPMVPKALIIMIPNCRIWSKLLELLGVSPKMKNESNTYAVFKYHY